MPAEYWILDFNFGPMHGARVKMTFQGVVPDMYIGRTFPIESGYYREIARDAPHKVIVMDWQAGEPLPDL